MASGQCLVNAADKPPQTKNPILCLGTWFRATERLVRSVPGRTSSIQSWNPSKQIKQYQTTSHHLDQVSTSWTGQDLNRMKLRQNIITLNKYLPLRITSIRTQPFIRAPLINVQLESTPDTKSICIKCHPSHCCEPHTNWFFFTAALKFYIWKSPVTQPM